MHTYTRTHAHSHLRMPSNYISLSSFHSSEPDFRLTSLRPAGYNKTTRTALLEYNNEVWASEGEDSQTCGPSWKRACLLGPRWKTNVCAGGFQRPGVVWGEEKRGGGVRALGGGGHQSLCFLSVLFGTRDLLLNSPYWLAGNVRSHVAVEKKSWQEGFAHGDRDAIVCRDTSQLFTTAFPVVEWLVDCSCSEEKKRTGLLNLCNGQLGLSKRKANSKTANTSVAVCV